MAISRDKAAAWAQGQLQAITHRAQIGGAGGEAIHALVGATNGFFLRARVVHHKRVPVHGHVAAGQGTKIHRGACVRGREQREVEFTRQLEPRSCMGVQALAQSRARGRHANIERLGKEVVTPKFFNRIEVVLALHQQTQVGLQNIAVGDAADTDREIAVKVEAFNGLNPFEFRA